MARGLIFFGLYAHLSFFILVNVIFLECLNLFRFWYKCRLGIKDMNMIRFWWSKVKKLTKLHINRIKVISNLYYSLAMRTELRISV